MTISADGLISMEFFNKTKTLTLVYEPGAHYSLPEIIEYADDMAERVIVWEGTHNTFTVSGGAGNWTLDFHPPTEDGDVPH